MREHLPLLSPTSEKIGDLKALDVRASGAFCFLPSPPAYADAFEKMTNSLSHIFAMFCPTANIGCITNAELYDPRVLGAVKMALGDARIALAIAEIRAKQEAELVDATKADVQDLERYLASYAAHALNQSSRFQ